MISLEWNDTLRVGHPLIDAQHQEIFARFDALLEGCNTGRAVASLQELFDFLHVYVREHFQVEEQLMQALEYPGREQHAGEHRDFTRRLTALRSQLAAHGMTPEVLIGTNKALIYWLTHHIRTVDTPLAGFLAPYP